MSFLLFLALLYLVSGFQQQQQQQMYVGNTCIQATNHFESFSVFLTYSFGLMFILLIAGYCMGTLYFHWCHHTHMHSQAFLMQCVKPNDAELDKLKKDLASIESTVDTYKQMKEKKAWEKKQKQHKEFVNDDSETVLSLLAQLQDLQSQLQSQKCPAVPAVEVNEVKDEPLVNAIAVEVKEEEEDNDKV